MNTNLDIVIRVEHLYKEYRLGVISHNTLYRELQTKWSKLRGGVDPNSLVTTENALDSNKDTSFLALKDVSFDLKKGEILGILGKNGAGKSTLLKVLSRVTTPSKGLVKIRGNIVSLLEVGTGFHPELTGRENVFLNGAVMGMSKREIEKKFDEIVSFAEVEKFIDTPVKRYSSGMYVRLAFSVAAHLEPDILIVDEVLAVGDAEFQKKCLGKMQSVSEQDGRAVLFVSHNMDAVQRLCNSALLLRKGEVVAQGDVKSIIADYLKADNSFFGEKNWIREDKIGNNFVKLIAVRAKNMQGIVSAEFKVTESIDLEIEFEVLEEANYDVHIYFSNQTGMKLFLATDMQDERWRNSRRPKGIHKCICYIPSNFLNEGTVSVLVGICSSPYSTHVVVDNAVYINIIDDFDISGARGTLIQKWPDTMVRPLLKWDFEYYRS